MHATEILMSEHRVIEQVLNCLQEIANRAEKEGRLDGPSSLEALDFFQHFADGCHHGKEEKHLFPLLEARGFPRQGGPTGVMLAEHEEGRRHVKAMAGRIDPAVIGDREAVQQFVHHARAFCALLHEHILKEDQRLFPMAQHALSEQDQKQLLESFAQTEEKDMGPGTHERYLQLADNLADRYKVPRASSSQLPVHTCCHYKN